MIKKILSTVIAAFAVGLAGVAQEKNTAEQERRMAVVELSTIYMRQAPDYESALETQELMGTVVEIVGEKGYWREIISPQPYKAWTTEKGLVEMSAEDLKAYEEAPKVMFTGLYGHVYTEPSFKASTICDLVGGDIMRLADDKQATAGDAIRLKGKWTKIMLPSGRKGYIPTETCRLHHGFRSISQGEGSADSISPETTEAIIAQAEKLLGVPYLWGGMSAKGVDCSGLVRISHIMNGILLPRNASQQINCGDLIPMEIDTKWWEVLTSPSASQDDIEDSLKEEMIRRTKDLERGDLVFFGTPATEPGKKLRITHVGIYLGNGKMIHSSHMVRINSLIPGSGDYYENSWRLVGAVRL